MISALNNVEKKFSLSKAAFIIGAFSMLTKLFAIYRLRVFGATFGQDKILDTYYSAFRIPDIITNLFILSTLSIAFLPIFTDLSTKNKEEANKMASTILNTSILGIGFLSFVFFIFAGPLTKVLVPGFSEEFLSQTVTLTRIFLICPIFFACSTIFGGVLNAKKQFLITSFTPILYTLGVISGVKVFYPHFGMAGLSYGVLAGAVAQMLLQFFFAFKNGYRWSWVFNIKTAPIKTFLKLYAPRVLAFDLIQITLILGTIIGSSLIAGSIAALNQAFDLQSTPLGVFAYAISLAAFPVFSEYFALRDEKSFIKTLSNTITQILFFMIPISILTLLFRAYIVRLILGFGKFTWEDTIMTFSILGIFSFSLWSQALTTLLSRAFFARQNTKIPVVVNLSCLVMNLSLGLILGKHYGIYGLTWAFVISSILNSLFLFTIMHRTLHKANSAEPELMQNFDAAVLGNLLKIILATLLMGTVSYAAIYLIEPLVNTHTVLGLLIQAGVAGGAGVLVYLLIASSLELTQAKNLIGLFKKKQAHK